MSRIGNKPVTLPDKVKVHLSPDRSVQVEGPKGKLSWRLPEGIDIGSGKHVIRHAHGGVLKRTRRSLASGSTWMSVARENGDEGGEFHGGEAALGKLVPRMVGADRAVKHRVKKQPNHCVFHVVAGLAGGTGSGTVVDVVSQIRKLYPYPGTHLVVLYLMLPEANPDPAWARANYHANGYAALAELNAISVGAYVFYPVGSTAGTIDILGEVGNVIDCAITQETVVGKPFFETEYSLGVGALGANPEDYLPLMGEAIMVAGAMVWLPTDGNNTPDYMIPRKASTTVVMQTGFNDSRHA